MWSETISGGEEVLAGKWGGLFWATSLEKISGGVIAIISFRPGGWMAAVCRAEVCYPFGREHGRHRAVRRREFISLLGGAAAVGSVTSVIPATAQQPEKVPRVGILTPAENGATPIFDAFRQGLRDLGYVDGKTIVLDFRFAKGNIDALPELAVELVRIPVDVIVVDATPSVRAAIEATRTIPIVIGAASDPVLLGFVASISRPGGNVTGMTIRGETLSSKRLQLLKQAFPGIASVSVLINPKNISTSLSLKATEEAARTLGISFVPLTVGTSDELRTLSAADLTRSDALTVLPDAIFLESSRDNHRGRAGGPPASHLSRARICGRRWPHCLWPEHSGQFPSRGGLRRSHSARGQARRSSDRRAGQVRLHSEFADGTRPRFRDLS